MPARTGCCKRTCGWSMFGPGDVDLLRLLEFHPADSADQWAFTDVWGPIDYENNLTLASTPASSWRRETRDRDRLGNNDFSIEFAVLPLFDPGIPGAIHGGQVGGFIANAFVVWVDFSDNTIRWDFCDEYGTITAAPGEGNLIKALDFFPVNLRVRACVYQNEKGTWNLEFHTAFLHNLAIVFDVALPGLDAGGSIYAGGVTGAGGGGISGFVFGCGACSQCNQCWDGWPLSWSIDAGSDYSDVIVENPTQLDLYDACIAIGQGRLDDSVTVVQINDGIFPTRNLHSNTIFWMLSTHDILHPGNGGNVAGLPPETIILSAFVGFEDDFGGGPAGRVIVAAWTCPWEEFCCYGTSTFTKNTLFPSPTNFGGEPGDLSIWYEQYGVWPTTVTIAAIGPPGDMPCTQTCVYKSYRETLVPPLGLFWRLLNNASNSHVECPGDCPPTPGFDPLYENQVVYVPCV